MDVSIVIVNYNVSDLLNNCIVSIKKETSCKYEIIVVDNNSKDNSRKMLKTYHPEVKLIQNEVNVGFAKANNQAFRVATGRYIFMLNPDTVVLDKAIDKLVQFMEEHHEAGACGPKNLNSDMSLQYNCHGFPTITMQLIGHLQLIRLFPKNKFFGRSDMTYWHYDELKEVDWITGCSLMIRKEALEEVGILDEKYFMYSEEVDLCLRLKNHNWKRFFCPYAAIIHYGGQSALNQDKEKVLANTIISHLFTSRYYFFKKNYGYISYVLLKTLELLYYSLYYSFFYSKNLIRNDKNIKKIELEKAKIVLSLLFNPIE